MIFKFGTAKATPISTRHGRPASDRFSFTSGFRKATPSDSNHHRAAAGSNMLFGLLASKDARPGCWF